MNISKNRELSVLITELTNFATVKNFNLPEVFWDGWDIVGILDLGLDYHQ